MGINEERQADDIAVSAGELQPVAALPQVRAHHDDFAVMVSLWPVKAGSLKQQVVAFHDPVHALMVNSQ